MWRERERDERTKKERVKEGGLFETSLERIGISGHCWRYILLTLCHEVIAVKTVDKFHPIRLPLLKEFWADESIVQVLYMSNTGSSAGETECADQLATAWRGMER